MKKLLRSELFWRYSFATLFTLLVMWTLAQFPMFKRLLWLNAAEIAISLHHNKWCTEIAVTTYSLTVFAVWMFGEWLSDIVVEKVRKNLTISW